MSYFSMDRELAQIRIDELMEDAKRTRRSERVTTRRAFQLPKLSNLFANWKPAKNSTAASRA